MTNSEESGHNAHSLGEHLYLFAAVASRLHEHTPPRHCAAVTAADANPDLAVHDVWTAAHMLLINSHDHLLALAVAMQQNRVNTAIWTLGRAAQENAARAHWLIQQDDPTLGRKDVDVQRLVARYYASLLSDLAQEVRLAQRRSSEEHKQALLLQETVANQARNAGFQVHKLSSRQRVDEEQIPDGQAAACLGLAAEDAWAGHRLYSQSSSIAHGSALGMLRLASDASRPDGRVRVRLWLKPEDAALIIKSCLLAHDLAYERLAELFAYDLDDTYHLTKRQLHEMAGHVLSSVDSE